MENGRGLPVNQDFYTAAEIQQRIDFVKQLNPAQPIKIQLIDKGEQRVIEFQDGLIVQYMDRSGKAIACCEQKVHEFIYSGDCAQIGLVEPQPYYRNFLWKYRSTRAFKNQETQIGTISIGPDYVFHPSVKSGLRMERFIIYDKDTFSPGLIESFKESPLTFYEDRTLQNGIRSLADYYQAQATDYALWDGVLLPYLRGNQDRFYSKIKSRGIPGSNSPKLEAIERFIKNLKYLTNNYLQVKRYFPTMFDNSRIFPRKRVETKFPIYECETPASVS